MVGGTIDISRLPEEVADYALDQLPDRLGGEHLHEAVRNLQVNEEIMRDYQRGHVTVGTTVIEEVLRRAIQEKINDIEREIQSGERTDYTRAEVRAMRETADQIFSTDKSARRPEYPGKES